MFFAITSHAIGPFAVLIALILASRCGRSILSETGNYDCFQKHHCHQNRTFSSSFALTRRLMRSYKGQYLGRKARAALSAAPYTLAIMPEYEPRFGIPQCSRS